MKLDPHNIPEHIAIIMDGNGRWARRRALPKVMGHRQGVKTAETILYACRDIGIRVLTLYTFSTENWKRSREEVADLMRLLERYLDENTEKLVREGVRLRTIGAIHGLPPGVRERLDKARTMTGQNERFTLNLALNYGSRTEIVQAARAASRDIAEGRIAEEDLDERRFGDYLYTKGMPDPDLLIRTSGEMRLSNFLLWQVSYAEIYVTRKLWPDFTPRDLHQAIRVFQKRERRFGGR